MTRPMKRVLIVGGGLAGLACGVRLQEAGAQPLIIEASDDVGGRVRTDVVDGFRLDRGFQVYLDAYPEAGKLLDLPSLDLCPFNAGALVCLDGRLHRVMDVFSDRSTASGCAGTTSPARPCSVRSRPFNASSFGLSARGAMGAAQIARAPQRTPED